MVGTPSTPLDRQTLSRITADVDRPLHSLGFVYSSFSPEKITGHLTVSEPWCQPFKRMHGGVTAFVAEGVASAGAYFASDYQRVAGVQLSVNYIKPAFLGDQVDVEATRILLGRTIQVWEVQQWKTSPTSGERVLLSTSMVTLSNLPPTKDSSGFEAAVKKYAKL